MAIVTVSGGIGHSAYQIQFGGDANPVLALTLLNVVTGAITGGTSHVYNFDPAGGGVVPTPTGTGNTLELNASSSSTVPFTVPGGYTTVVDGAPTNTALPGNNTTGVGQPETINGGGLANLLLVAYGDLVAHGELTFSGAGTADTIMAGGGANSISGLLGGYVQTGDGNDTISVLTGANTVISGGGIDLIRTFSGTNRLTIGPGGTAFQSGVDTIVAGGANDTITVRNTDAVVFAGSGTINFAGGSGSESVYGSTNSTTMSGGTGSLFANGGTQGNNHIIAGDKFSIINGGGNGDVLSAAGSAGDWIAAAGGNETLTGGTSTGKNYLWAGSGSDSIGGGLGEDTIYASTGNATMTGGSGTGSNYFVFFNGQAGGSDIIANFRPGLDQVDLVGYGASQIAVAVGNQQQVSTPLGGGTQVILSDNTHITFIGLTSVSSSNFVTNV